MRTVLIFITIACLYAQSAHAGGNGMTSLLTGVFQGMNQKQAEIDAQNNAANIQNALLSQYQQCLQSRSTVQIAPPNTKIYEDYDATNRKATQCVTSVMEDFKREHSNSPAMWLINGQVTGNSDNAHTPRASTLEGTDLRLLISKRNECWNPVLYYSGKKDVYLKRATQTISQRLSAESALLEDYIAGKITKADVFNRETQIAASFNQQNTKISNSIHTHIKKGSLANTRQVISPEQQKICDAQLEYAQREIEHQQMMQEIQQQNQAAFDNGRMQGQNEGYVDGLAAGSLSNR